MLNVAWVVDVRGWQGPLPVGAPILEPGSGVALATQGDDTLTAVAIDPDGVLHVAWVDGTGRWQGPLPVGPPALDPRSDIALARQSDGTLTAVALDRDGALHVAWVDDVGDWHGPVPIGGSALDPGSGIGLAKQNESTLAAVGINPNGRLNVAWVDENGRWNGPVDVGDPELARAAGVGVAKQADGTLTAAAIGGDGTLWIAWVDDVGDWRGPVPVGAASLDDRSGVALAKQGDDTLTAAAIDEKGTLHVAWVDEIGDWQGPVPVGRPVLDPSSGVALSRQVADTFTAAALDRDGVINVAWVDDVGDWQGPVPIHGGTRRVCQLTGDYDPEDLAHVNNSLEAGVGGTDLGFPVEHEDSLLFLFGDQFGLRDQRDADPIGIARTGKVEADGFRLDFLTEDSDPHRFLPLRVPELDYLGALDTPTGGFSHDGRLWAFVNKGVRGSRDSQTLLASTGDPREELRLHYAVAYVARDGPPRSAPPGLVAHDRLSLAGARVIDAGDWPGVPGNRGNQGLLIWGQAESSWKACLGYVELPLSTPTADHQFSVQQLPIQYYAGHDPGDPAHPNWTTQPAWAEPLFDTPSVTFLSVSYVPSLERWLALYTEAWPFDAGWNPADHPGEEAPWRRPIVARSAPTPWGPWSDPLRLLSPTEAYGRYLHNPAGGAQPARFAPDDVPILGWLYAPLQIDRFTRALGDRTEIYFLLSTGKPYQVQLMRVQLRRRQGG